MQKELDVNCRVLSHMALAFDANPGVVLLGAVVAFIVLCTLASLIIKEIFRRR